MENTEDFIVRNLNRKEFRDLGTNPNSLADEVIEQTVSISNCAVTINRKTNGEQSYSHWISKANVQNIRQDSGEVNYFRGYLQPKDDPYVIATMNFANGPTDSKFTFFTSNEPMAKRLFSAFAGLSKLCGAKADPY